MDELEIDDGPAIIKKLRLDIQKRTADLKQVMPIAMRNMAISQQRDMERFRNVRGGKYDRPKAKFVVGEFVMLRRKKSHTLQPGVRPHILRIKELRKSRVVILQGRDGTTISHQTSQIARCSVPVADKKIYPELYIRTKSVHFEKCGRRQEEGIMVLCDKCNKGFHTKCLYPPLTQIPKSGWTCDEHEVHPVN